MKAVANATPLIALSLVDGLDLLSRVFGEVLVPREMAAEGIRIHPRLITWLESELHTARASA